jgi:regulator of protease activity HflC (stomatin/prohibitin superfamily)
VSPTNDDLRELGPWGQSVALAFRFLLLAASLIACGWLFSNFHQIPPDSQAIVMRFGSVARLHGSGLLFAWPSPIEQVAVLPAAARQFQLPVRRYNPDEADVSNRTRGFFISSDPRQNGGFLLTGDSSVVHLEARLFYQIDDPLAYMIAAGHVEAALERLFLASAVAIVAGRDLDSVLVARPEIASQATEAARREGLRGDLMNAVNRRLDDLRQQGASLGIAVSRVDLVPSIPAGAKEAFENVLVVTQDAEARAAVARTSAEVTAQEANRNKDRIAAGATAAAEELVTAAKTQIAPITALEEQSHDVSRDMQLTRVYYDHVGPLLRKARRVEVVDSSGAVHVILPGGSP